MFFMLKRLRIYIILLISLLLILVGCPVYAIDDIDEALNIEEIDSILKSVDVEVKDTPNINSRHAVIYDRKTRKSFIWKKRK